MRFLLTTAIFASALALGACQRNSSGATNAAPASETSGTAADTSAMTSTGATPPSDTTGSTAASGTTGTTGATETTGTTTTTDTTGAHRSVTAPQGTNAPH